MNLPQIDLKALLKANVHFGHKVQKWNPKMQNYIYGHKDGVHIVDLTQTIPLMQDALKVCYEVASKGGRILFVGTKRQASDMVAETAKQCGQYYVNHRWLGGMLTNWKTISESINRLKKLEQKIEKESKGLTKKEILTLTREVEKMQTVLNGIRDMGGYPDLLIVFDVNREMIAIKEAQKYGIPILAVVDTNCDPDVVDYAIPGNDDSTKAIALYCELFSKAIVEGMMNGRQKKQRADKEEINQDKMLELKKD